MISGRSVEGWKVDGTFLEGRKVEDKWDVDFKIGRASCRERV